MANPPHIEPIYFIFFLKSKEKIKRVIHCIIAPAKKDIKTENKIPKIIPMAFAVLM